VYGIPRFKKERKKEVVMSSLLSNDYAVVFGALRSLGYLSVDLSVISDGLRGGMLSSDVLSRVFVVSATPADVKAVKPKRTVTPSAYACFLAAKRVDIKAMLKEETPEISAKDLNMSVMRKAGEIWKTMSDDDKRVYVEQSSALKSSSPVVAEEAKPKKESKTNKQKEAKPKKESKPKTKKEVKPKKESKPSAYMCFLAAKRVEIRMLLKQETPEISAKELNLSVMRKAGEIWKAMSEDEKRIYVDQSSSLKSSVGSVVVIADEVPKAEEVVAEVKEEVTAEVVEEAEAEAEEDEDEDVLVYNATFNVWVHDVSGMYYAENDIDGEPLGQLKTGKLVPFKKSSSKKSVAK